MTSANRSGIDRVEAGPDEAMIVEAIFAAVMEQRLPPRTKLSEAALCDTFGVGRMRVRRALLLLGSQGIVDLRSNRGAFIANPSAEDAREVFEARLMLEPGLVRKLAVGISHRAVEALIEHIEQEDAARARDNRTEMVRLSGEFHVKLAEAHGNAVLTRMLRELVTRSSLIVGLFSRNRRSACPADEHSQIVTAILQGDRDLAETKVLHHLQHIQNGLDLEREPAPETNLAKILRRE